MHARELSAVLAQWVNSYKRLVPGYEAPVYVAWSQRNRSALIRIPLYKPGSEQATRAEIRCPDPACNPYLAFAALLHAGLEGIEKGYKLPDEMTTNLYRLSDEERERARHRGAARVARRGDRGVRRLGADAAALGEHIFPRYVELKRAEWDEYRIQVSQWELDRYLAALYDGGMRGLPAHRAGRADGELLRFGLDNVRQMAHHRRCRRSRKASGALVSDGRSRVPDEGPVVVVD